jgi:hypothetical protein
MTSIDDGGHSRASRVSRIIGIGLYLLTGWLYLGTPLVVPYPWVFGFWSTWIGGLVALARVVRRYPVWTPVVAVAAVGLWVAAVGLGGWLLGWTA